MLLASNASNVLLAALGKAFWDRVYLHCEVETESKAFRQVETMSCVSL